MSTRATRRNKSKPLIASPPSAGFWLEAWRRFRRRKLSMIALAFVVFLLPRGAVRAGDRRHQADRLQVQGLDLLSRASATSIAAGRIRSSSSDRFRGVYPDES